MLDRIYSSKAGLLALALVTVYIASTIYSRLQLYRARRKFMAENGCQPCYNKYPLIDPILGLDMMRENIRNSKNLKFLECAKKRFDTYGNTYTSKLLTTPIILTIEPQNVKTILSLRFKDFGIGNRQSTLGPLLGKGIFTTDGDRWAHSRSMIRPNFTRDQVADLEAFERHIQELYKLIPRDGSTVDLQELFFRFTIDSATEFLFGQSVDSLRMTAGEGGQSEASFAEAFNYAQHACAQRFRLGWLYNVAGDKKAETATRICHDYVDQFVDAAIRYRQQRDADPEKAEKEEKYVFLHELARATGDKRRLRDELLNVLLAGRDTTASLLSNMFFVVAKRPDVWKKMRDEVERELGGALPTYEQLRNLKYLKYVLNESLRLHPVVPGNSRMAMTDSVLPLGGGPDGKSPLFVPKGTIVGYSPYSMHRRKDYYGADADEFRPERWETLRPGWEYLPFNGGPRICLGQQYALTEAGYVAVRILQEFRGIESRDPEPWRENLTLTVCSKFGTKVALTPA